MIYFIRNPGDDSIKIGYSLNPKSRMQQLQTGCAHKLELLGMIDGGVELEQDIHAILAPHRMEGEWFRGGDEVLTFIRLVSAGREPVDEEITDSVIDVWHVQGTVAVERWEDRRDVFFYLMTADSEPEPKMIVAAAASFFGGKMHSFRLDRLMRIGAADPQGMDIFGPIFGDEYESSFQDPAIDPIVGPIPLRTARAICDLAVSRYRIRQELAALKAECKRLRLIEAAWQQRLQPHPQPAALPEGGELNGTPATN